VVLLNPVLQLAITPQLHETSVSDGGFRVFHAARFGPYFVDLRPLSSFGSVVVDPRGGNDANTSVSKCSSRL
jgi:hypothetical protein